ncbi:MAG: hypothetical protein R2751_14975 [Bacteroidales bacterium]
MKGKLLPPALLLLVFPLVSAQTGEDRVTDLLHPIRDTVEAVREMPESGNALATPGRFHLTAGAYTGFSSLGGFQGLHVSPGYTLPLSGRLALHGGVSAGVQTGLGGNLSGETGIPTAWTSLSVYLASSYRLSENLTLHGSVRKTLLEMPLSPATSLRRDDYTLGASYRLGDNITIGASVRVRQGSGGMAPWGSPFEPTFGNPVLYPAPDF